MRVTPRRRLRARTALLAGAFVVGLAATARADEAVTDEGAQLLEQQVRDWVTGLLGPKVDLGDHPLHITADADHYRVELPFAAPLESFGLTVEGDPLTGKLTPLDGGRWALDDVRLPSPLRLSYTAPGAAKPGTGGAATFTATIESQEQHAVLDPTLATPSHWDATLKGYNSSTEGSKEMGSSTFNVDQMTVHTAWEPVQDGRLNIVQESDSHLLASNSMMPNGKLASFTAERVRGALRLTGVAPDQLAPVIHALVELAPAGAAAAQAASGQAAKAPADPKALRALQEQNRAAAEEDKRGMEADKQAVAEGRMTPAERKKNNEDRRARAQERVKAIQAARLPAAKPQLTAEQHATLHAGLLALAGLMNGFDEHGSMENVHIVAVGYSAHLGKIASGFSVSTVDGRAVMHLNFVLDGLDSPEIPPGVYRTYLPRHIAISPRIGGVPATDLRDFLLHAADSNGDDPQLQDQAKALLQKGPVAVGLDELSLDFGPATLKGSGEVRVSGVDHYEGEARFAATGLDELIQQANTVPELKQAAPVLFLLKGMGRQDGATTVWDVTYHDGKALVNGNDLSAMMPGK